MSIFSSLQTYAQKWSVKSSRKFTEEEINMVERAVVVPSQYGNSVCFHMLSGGMTFIPLATDATLGVGEDVDLKKATILTLEKSGENDINRILI